MPPLPTIKATLPTLPTNNPPFVAVLTGGTTGIGSYVAASLARTYALHGSKLRVYIVGRNAERAAAVIAAGKTTAPGSDWRFVKVEDLSLIGEVDRACEEVVRLEGEGKPLEGGGNGGVNGKGRVDLLYMSHASSPLVGRSTTAEGLDSFISTLYYTRIRLIQRLLPLLLSSVHPTGAHIISIYAGGMTEDAANVPGMLPQLLGCPPPAEYSITSARRNVNFMKTFMFEELAKRHEGKLSLVHIYPGLVDGPAFYNAANPWWWKWVWGTLKPVLGLVFMTKPEDCGDVMVFLATGGYPAMGKGDGGEEVVKSTLGVMGGGSYAVGQRGDAFEKGLLYDKIREEGMGLKVWEHTMGTFDEIEKKNSSRI